jgi:Transport protein Avl9
MLADRNTTSYVVGSTNSLLLAQRDRYCDILINVGVYGRIYAYANSKLAR